MSRTAIAAIDAVLAEISVKGDNHDDTTDAF
jgi:hypothetical protein